MISTNDFETLSQTDNETIQLRFIKKASQSSLLGVKTSIMFRAWSLGVGGGDRGTSTVEDTVSFGPVSVAKESNFVGFGRSVWQSSYGIRLLLESLAIQVSYLADISVVGSSYINGRLVW